MKLAQCILCKTPFTPSYEHLVTGCSNSEFYNKLSKDENNHVIDPSYSKDNYFRAVRETDREIVIEITMLGDLATYLKPYEFNYIATTERDPFANRFWFIESYNVDNALVWPTVTFHCSIDYWHSYMLQKTPIDQNIVRLTQNGRYIQTNQFLPEDSSIPHRVQYISNDRILWARVRINTIYFTHRPAIGSSLEGTVPFVYIPIGIVKNNTFYFLERDNSLTLWSYSFDSTIGYVVESQSCTLNNSLGAEEEVLEGSIVLQYVGGWGFVESASLTYVPPFYYSFDSNSNTIYVGDNNRIVFKIDGMRIVGIVPNNSDEYHTLISYDLELPSPSDTAPNVYFYNRYPFRYYSIFVGETEYKFPYPISRVTIEINSKCCGDSNVATIWVDSNKIADNVQINLYVPLPINKDSAGMIEATYGSQYRSLSGLSKILPHAGSLISLGKPTSGSIVSKFVSSANLFKSALEWQAEENKPSSTYIPQSSADSVAFGDYPFIVRHDPFSSYLVQIDKRISVYGEKVLIFGNPIVCNHKYYDFVKTEGSELFSFSLNDRGNIAISNAFNRGVHLWHYDNLTNIANVGNFDKINTNR